MNNYERDPEKIKEAFDKGIITKGDYEKWQGVQGYKSMLKKSKNDSEISQTTYANESGKANSYFFERDLSANTLRFTLRGLDFQPIDLMKAKEIIKSMQQKPLQRTQPVRVVNDSLKKVNALIDDISQIQKQCAATLTATKKRFALKN